MISKEPRKGLDGDKAWLGGLMRASAGGFSGNGWEQPTLVWGCSQ